MSKQKKSGKQDTIRHDYPTYCDGKSHRSTDRTYQRADMRKGEGDLP